MCARAAAGRKRVPGGADGFRFFVTLDVLRVAVVAAEAAAVVALFRCRVLRRRGGLLLLLLLLVSVFL